MCLHGFAQTWRTWELILPALADEVGRAMDRAGLPLAHLAGTSLGGWVALQLAARADGRGRSWPSPRRAAGPAATSRTMAAWRHRLEGVGHAPQLDVRLETAQQRHLKTD